MRRRRGCVSVKPHSVAQPSRTTSSSHCALRTVLSRDQMFYKLHSGGQCTGCLIGVRQNMDVLLHTDSSSAWPSPAIQP